MTNLQTQANAMETDVLNEVCAKADAARSLEDQRAALREYYRRIFAHISKQDKSLANKCKGLEDAYLRRLAQYRLEPTNPLNPPPTPEPIN